MQFDFPNTIETSTDFDTNRDAVEGDLKKRQDNTSKLSSHIPHPIIRER